jgi:hypothetical protein
MSKAVKGSGVISAEFDQRMQAVQKLKEELASNEEISFEFSKICDWISASPTVRRNLNGQRLKEIIQCRDFCSNHEVWPKVEVMLQTRHAQNSVERKRQLRLERESKPVVEQTPSPQTNNEEEGKP